MDGMTWEIETDICARPCLKHVTNGNLLYSAGSSAQRSVVAWMGGMGVGGKEGQEEGDICIHIADLFCYTAETNPTL